MRQKILFELCAVLVFALLVSISPAQTSAAGSPQTKPTQKTSSSAQSTSKLDINSATKDELMTLPGISEATAQKIIDKRPYRAKNQLVSKKVIPKSTYQKIKDQIIAHRKKAS